MIKKSKKIKKPNKQTITLHEKSSILKLGFMHDYS